MSFSPRIAIMGATGAVGQELLELIEERKFPFQSLKLLASARSAGKEIQFLGKTYTIEELTHDSFSDVDLVLSSAGGSISKEFVPSAVKSGALVVDNTSFYRMDPEVPLVVPEINPEKIMAHKGIIANPNCSTIIMLLPIWPLHKKYGVRRLLAATYQAASGAGAQAMDELREESLALSQAKDYKNTVIPHQYAFNCFPHNSAMEENGYCQEENKMINETRKIFNNDSFRVSATCVRVPVLRAHSEVLNVEFEKHVSVDDLYKDLENCPGVEIFEDRDKNRWAMPIDVSGKDNVYVGRLRKDASCENGIEMWVVGDQVRKGAALNAIQIAEKWLEYK